jgi:hypothetical protein
MGEGAKSQALFVRALIEENGLAETRPAELRLEGSTLIIRVGRGAAEADIIKITKRREGYYQADAGKCRLLALIFIPEEFSS